MCVVTSLDARVDDAPREDRKLCGVLGLRRSQRAPSHAPKPNLAGFIPKYPHDKYAIHAIRAVREQHLPTYHDCDTKKILTRNCASEIPQIFSTEMGLSSAAAPGPPPIKLFQNQLELALLSQDHQRTHHQSAIQK